jgi:hypothetical protein
MDRKQFLTTVISGGAGAAVCGLIPCCGAAIQASQTQPASPELQRRVNFTENWVKRLMVVVDKQLDPASRQKLMESNGRACFASQHGERPAKPEPGGLEKQIAELKKWTGEEGVRREVLDDVVTHNFTDAQLGRLRFFYLRGGFDFARLQPRDKVLMTLLKWKMSVKKLLKRPLEPDETGMLSAYGKPVDFAKRKNIGELVEYMRRAE